MGLALAEACSERRTTRDAVGTRRSRDARLARDAPGRETPRRSPRRGDFRHQRLRRPQRLRGDPFVTPAQTTREVASKLVGALKAPRPLVICAKGIEVGGNLFLSEVLAEAAPGWPRAVLSGPSFAVDVAAGLPTAVTLAAEDETLAIALSSALKAPNLRLYHSTDMRGVELGGAAKNVLAIGCGVAGGPKTRRQRQRRPDRARLCRAQTLRRRLWGPPHTLMGLSGLGDLVLTCSSTQSRNFSFGLALGRGDGPPRRAEESSSEGATHGRALDQPRARKKRSRCRSRRPSRR